MSLGSVTSVSIIVIMIRRHFFRARFQNLVENDPSARKRCEDVEAAEKLEQQRQQEQGGFMTRMFKTQQTQAVEKRPKVKRLDTSMIRRVDEPVKVNQMNNEGHVGRERTSFDSVEKEDQNQTFFPEKEITEEPRNQNSLDVMPSIMESRRPSLADFET